MNNLDNATFNKIKQNVISMLKNRKIDFKNIVYKTKHLYIENNIYVRFILNNKVKPNEVKLNLDKIIQKKLNLKQVILVLLKKPNNSILKVIKPYRKQFNIQIFWKDELIIDKIKHKLVPKHVLIKEKDLINEILDKYQIKSISKLPFILSTDPIAKYYNAEKGNLFRIERDSITSGKYVTYRCVY